MKITSARELTSDFDIMQKFDEIMYLNRLGLVTVGIWPMENSAASKMLFYFRRIHIFIIYFFIFSVLVMQWFDIYSLWGNIDANTETFMSNVFIVAVMIKITNFFNSMHIFKDIIKTMRLNWINAMKLPNSEENKNIMYSLAIKARDRGNKYGAIILFTAMMYFVMPFFAAQETSTLRERIYPFFGNYFIDRNSDLIYGLCYLSQIITGSIVGIANYATDTIFLVCVYHSCAQLRILQNDMMDLGKEEGSARTTLINLIRRHQMEIRHARALQSIFSGSSLQQLFSSCLMICVNGFKLIVSLNNREVDFIRYAVCMPLMLFQILFYCQPGNELIVQSQSLQEAIYQSSWMNLDRVTMRHLILMIQRSQKPLRITAGKIYELSLQNFMTILKTSMSALSVLQAVYKEKEQN